VVSAGGRAADAHEARPGFARSKREVEFSVRSGEKRPGRRGDSLARSRARVPALACALAYSVPFRCGRWRAMPCAQRAADEADGAVGVIPSIKVERARWGEARRCEETSRPRTSLQKSANCRRAGGDGRGCSSTRRFPRREAASCSAPSPERRIRTALMKRALGTFTRAFHDLTRCTRGCSRTPRRPGGAGTIDRARARARNSSPGNVNIGNAPVPTCYEAVNGKARARSAERKIEPGIHISFRH